MLAGFILTKFQKVKGLEHGHSNLQRCFGQTKTQTGPVCHETDSLETAHVETVGDCAIRVKILLGEVPNQNLTSKTLVKFRNALQESCFQIWKTCVRGQTLST